MMMCNAAFHVVYIKKKGTGKRTYMLIDQDDPNILALGRKGLKGALDGGVVGLAVHDQEVLLCLRWRRDVLNSLSPSLLLIIISIQDMTISHQQLHANTVVSSSAWFGGSGFGGLGVERGGKEERAYTDPGQ